MLRLEAVSKRYRRGPPVLTEIDLDMWAGSVLAVEGSVLFTCHGGAGAGVAADSYELSGGRLHRRVPRGPVRPWAEVVLSAPPGGAHPAPVEWSTLPGVVDLMPDGTTTVTIRVAEQHRDGLLLAALTNGWSVLGLRRPAETPRGSGQLPGRHAL